MAVPNEDWYDQGVVSMGPTFVPITRTNVSICNPLLTPLAILCNYTGDSNHSILGL
jgi:hypothetical protein